MTWQEDDEKRKIRAELDGLRRDVDEVGKVKLGDGYGCVVYILTIAVFLLVMESPTFHALRCLIPIPAWFVRNGC